MVKYSVYLFLVLVLLVADLAVSQSTSQSICTFCDCLPRGANVVTSVDCKCEGRKSLSLASGQMTELSRAKSFKISECSRVNLDQSSFLSLKELKTMDISSCGTVTILPGVFESLFTLKIDHVRELILRPKAFMGARDVMSVTISNTIIPTIPTHAFFDWTGLDQLELANVTIDEIEANAINITMRHMSRFMLLNSQINRVQPYATKIVSYSTLVAGTSFPALPRNGLTLHAQESLNISQNMFGNLEHSSIRLQSRNIDILNNKFGSISGNEFQETKILKNIADLPGSFNFKDNDIRATDFQTILRNLYNLGTRQNALTEITSNMFICDCGNLPVYSEEDGIYLTVMNFCRTPCTAQVFNFLVMYDQVCPSERNSLTSMNNSALCMQGNVTMDMATTMMETFLNKTREGREMNKPTDTQTNLETTTIGIIPHFPEEVNNHTKPNTGSYLTTSAGISLLTILLYLFY